MIDRPAPAAAPPAAVTFLVRGVVVFGTRSLFIVRGTVLTGTARPGQRVLGIPGMDASVAGVESGLLDITGGPAQTALTFRFTKQAQLAQWQSLITDGIVFSLGALTTAR